ncbi:kinase-like domain, phloem protein 2-like protein [Tanacetum coccineum]
MENDSGSQRIKIRLQVARGLCYLHRSEGDRQEIVYRDIKSANILLDANLDARIGDFWLDKGARCCFTHLIEGDDTMVPLILDIHFSEIEFCAVDMELKTMEDLAGKECCLDSFICIWDQLGSDSLSCAYILLRVRESMTKCQITEFRNELKLLATRKMEEIEQMETKGGVMQERGISKREKSVENKGNMGYKTAPWSKTRKVAGMVSHVGATKATLPKAFCSRHPAVKEYKDFVFQSMQELVEN